MNQKQKTGLLFCLMLFLLMAACNPAGSATDCVSKAKTKDGRSLQVVGQLMVKQDGETREVPEIKLYLAPAIKDEKGQEAFVGFDRQSPLQSITDSQGCFAFYDIEVGRYGLVLDDIISSYLLMKPDGQDAMLVEIKDENVLQDLGQLIYDTLPIILDTPSYPPPQAEASGAVYP